jgi:PBP1b-binding outer membrane lipoprotein LpoB
VTIVSRTVLGLLTVTLLLAGCSSDAGERATPETTQAGPAQLAAEVGSYDLAAGKKTRFMVGLIAGENRFVS